MVDRPVAGSIAAASASREGLILARSILGTVDAVRIIGDLDSFCAARLGSGIEDVCFCELSVGAAFGLSLRDGRRVLLKVNPPDRTRRSLEAVYRVQRHLYARGFPCPGPSDVPRRASPEEARLFVDEYEIARAKPFSEQERIAVSAAAAYGLAYTARCEHALDTAGDGLRGGFREALAYYGEEYLRL